MSFSLSYRLETPTGPLSCLLRALHLLLVAAVCYAMVSWSSAPFFNATQPSVLWSLFYFSHAIYVLFAFSTILYVLSNLPLFTLSGSSTPTYFFSSLDGTDLFKLLVTPLMLILSSHLAWSGPSVIAWFGHFIFSSYQSNLTYLLFFLFTTYLFSFASSTHYSSLNAYDYSISTFNFFFWIWLMFFSNNLFTFVFFLELLSASITLTLVTSTFASSNFYNNLSYSKHSYFASSTPTAFLQTLMFFFWITLVTSLLLFLLLLVFYTRFVTFDWNLVESVFSYLVTVSSLRDSFLTSFAWVLFLICTFLKCGIAPFYLWKPSFFKGLGLITLFFYVYVFYFSAFFYFIYVLFFYLNELFMFNLYVVVWFLIGATLSLSVILFESFYLKAFLALSSILNSVLILYALCSLQSTDLLFII